MQRIINPGRQAPRNLVDGFLALSAVYSLSCIVADSQSRASVMRSYMRMLDPKTKIIGSAVTVRLSPGDLVDALDIIRIAQEGDVVVVDAFGETETSVWGGLMSGLCEKKGIAGAVIDGAIRDVDEIRDLGFPIMSKAIVPRSTHSPFSNRYEPLMINFPINCGGVVVHPGDLVIGDEIGCVVVPIEDLDYANKVLIAASEQAEKEERSRRKIAEGKSIDELLEEFGRI